MRELIAGADNKAVERVPGIQLRGWCAEYYVARLERLLGSNKRVVPVSIKKSQDASE